MRFYILFFMVFISINATRARNLAWQNEIYFWGDVTDKSPQKARGYNNLGKALFHQGLLQQALGVYETALRLQPGFADAHIGIGTVYAALKRYELAFEHYERALQLNPTSAVAHYHLGLLFLAPAIQDADKAKREFAAALQLQPRYDQARIFLNFAAGLNEH
jgi:tetratricopeptide (TPR) repeat protein